MENLRAFKVTQKFDINGNRVTTVADIRNNKKTFIRNTYEDDAELVAVEFLKEKGIEISFKYENEQKKELILLSLNFADKIK